MPSNDDFGPPSGDSSPYDQTPTTHPHWPNITPVDQAKIERKWFEEGATIHFDRLPKRPGDWNAAYVITSVVKQANAAQRPLTASEIDATSEAAGISTRYMSWIRPLTIASSLFYTFYSRKSYSFAFYRPKASRFDPSVFPAKRIPLFRGQRAVLSWHALRTLTYMPVFMLFYGFFFASLTQTTFEAYIMRDPRLQAMRRDIKANQQKAVSAQAQQRNPPIQSSNSADRSPQIGEREPYASNDEAHPASQSPWTRTIPSQAPPSQAEGGSVPAPRSAWNRTAQSQAPPSHPRDDVSDLFDDDDGSPVSASTRRAEAQQARNSQGSSTWDRLRQQAQSGSAQWTQGDSSGQERGWGQLRQDKTRNSKEVQRNTEGFAYTKDEEDREQRNYEKERAQKEFDALLEAERRGGSGRG
ncbi:hypothetical protein GGR53DRAFT_477875 [Hypoxylon sp. FL1150]|nr:hypothetical protein GGR53DRAFT_477875 [Hypoxylon sp. FL1150]